MGLELLGLDAADVLHIGDSRSSDVAGARSLSIPVAWLNRMGRDETGEPRASHVVGHLVEPIAIVRPQ